MTKHKNNWEKVTPYNILSTGGSVNDRWVEKPLWGLLYEP